MALRKRRSSSIDHGHNQHDAVSVPTSTARFRRLSTGPKSGKRTSSPRNRPLLENRIPLDVGAGAGSMPAPADLVLLPSPAGASASGNFVASNSAAAPTRPIRDAHVELSTRDADDCKHMKADSSVPRQRSSTLTRGLCIAVVLVTGFGVRRLWQHAVSMQSTELDGTGAGLDHRPTGSMDPQFDMYSQQLPQTVKSDGNNLWEHVFWHAWLTAVSTGLGVVPFVVGRLAGHSKSQLPGWVLGVSNAIAAGMMLAACLRLAIEGAATRGTVVHPDSINGSSSVQSASLMAIIDDPVGGVIDSLGSSGAAAGSQGVGSSSAPGVAPSASSLVSLLVSALGWIASSAGIELDGASTDVNGAGKGLGAQFALAFGAFTPMLLGLTLGVIFVLFSKRLLDSHEDLKFQGFRGLDARKVLLILAVMTLHSATEGIGIGVSFGTPGHEHQRHGGLEFAAGSGAGLAPKHHNSDAFGEFISATMAVHNIPEGLATCLVLIPRGSSLAEAFLWSVFTSLPQPLMAVPAYLSVTHFANLLPIGLGFAAGAMAWVALAELLQESAAEVGKRVSGVVTAIAFCVMWGIQTLLEHG